MVKTIGNVQKDAQVRAVASGNLSNGDTIIVNSDGTVSAVATVPESLGTAVTFDSDSVDRPAVAYDTTNNKVVIAYSNNSDNAGYAIVGTVSGSTITFGTPVQFNGGGSDHAGITIGNDKVFIVYEDEGNSSNGTAIIGTISGNSISFGTEYVFNSGLSIDNNVIYDSGNDKFLVFYRDGSAGYGALAVVATVSGTAISFSSYTTLSDGASAAFLTGQYDPTVGASAVFFRDTNRSYYGVGKVVTISGTSITTSGFYTVNAAQTNYMSSSFDPVENKIAVFYQDAGNSQKGTVRTATITASGASGTLSFGDEQVFADFETRTDWAVYATTSGVHAVLYHDQTDGYKTKIKTMTLSGTTFTFGAQVDVSDSTSDEQFMAYDSDTNQIIISYKESASPYSGKVALFAPESTTLTSDNFIGFSDGTYTQPPANIGAEATYGNVGFSSMAYDTTNNKVVIAYRDKDNSNYGTAIVGTVSEDTVTFGSAAVFESAEVQDTSVAFDANTGKVLITYRDNGNSGYGTAVVGTVSGTSITFGTPVVFESASTQYNTAVYDANAQKVVNFYGDVGNSTSLTAIVLTISGTSVSAGSPTVANSGASYNYAAVYDSSAQKVVVGFRDNASGAGKALVGTVSGTSISFGSSTTFTSNVITETTAAYDVNANKTVIAYRDNTASNVGKAIVGTVSGTSISFGTEVTFNNASTDETASTYNSDDNTVIIAYKDQGNSDYATYIIGTVSGTSISFGSEVVLAEESARPRAVVYDPDQQRTIFQYLKDTGTIGTVRSVNAVENPQTGPIPVATILSTCSVARNQTSLTAGQKYYVQGDGALGLTPADPSVEAGTAISSTEILVKG